MRGGDFLSFWAGAKFGALHHAAAAYDPALLQRFMEGVIRGTPVPSMYSYPPTATLLWLPLACLPFRLALISWIAAGTAVCGVLLARIVRWDGGVLLAIGTPAAVFDTWLAQDGHFTAALFAGGLLLIEQRPALAGMFLGALCYKPQLAILLPVALLAGGQRRVFYSAAATVIALLVCSIALFGSAAWSGWLGSQLPIRANLLANPVRGSLDVPSVYRVARLLGASGLLAWGMQIASAATATLALWSIWRNRGAFEDKAAGLAVATFLAAPYFRRYDEVVLVFAAAWIEVAGEGGDRRWRTVAAIALFALPVASRIGITVIAPLILSLVLGGLVLAGAPHRKLTE